MVPGSLLEGLATVDPLPVEECAAARQWRLVDVPAICRGLPTTIVAPLDLYGTGAGVSGGSTLPAIGYLSTLPGAASICETRASGSAASGLSTHIDLTRFAFPVLGQTPAPQSDGHFLAGAWDCGWHRATAFLAVTWLKPVLERLHYLQGLAPGWDSPGARSIEPRSFDRVLRFLTVSMTPQTPAPSIVPLENGGLQIEWHRAGLDVEVEFEPGEEAHLYFHEISTGEEREGTDPLSLFTVLELGGRLSAGYDPADAY
jgi:hypothetical protein